MPKINNPLNDTCFLCGSQAYFISFNTHNPRCVERITQCPGFVKKCKIIKDKKFSQEDRIAHSKIMSINGNAKLSELHKDPNGVKIKVKIFLKARLKMVRLYHLS